MFVPLGSIVSIFGCRLRLKCHTLETGRPFTPVFEDTVRPKRIAWMLSLVFLFAIPGDAQRQGPPPRVDGTVAPGDADSARDQLARDMAKKANEERQAALKADTDKLVKLAGELKDYVDKTNENVLSLDVLRKAEEIEKLAHSVKERMKG